MKYFKLLLTVWTLFFIGCLFLFVGCTSSKKDNEKISKSNSSFKITKLVEGIYELTIDAGGYPDKVIVSSGKDGLLIVDSGDKEEGEALVAALKTLHNGMPKIIINTHSHIEHIGGNLMFGNNPIIIGHKNTRDRYINGLYVFNEIPDSVLPNVTFTDSLSVFFNGEEIKLLAFPGAHDNGDIIVWFTKSKVVCTAALCNNHHFPSIDGETGNILKYPEIVAKIISILPEDVLIVPGHSDVCHLKEYREFYDMLVKTSGIIKAELEKGKTLKQLQNEDILKDWKSWESYADRGYWVECWVNAFQNPKIVTTKRKIYAPIYHMIHNKGIDSAIALYNNLKTYHSDQYEFEERTPMFIGRRLANNGRGDDGIKFLNLCITEYPNTEASAISQLTIGNIYWKSGKKVLAREHYKEYLGRYPNDKTILDRMKEVEENK